MQAKLPILYPCLLRLFVIPGKWKIQEKVQENASCLVPEKERGLWNQITIGIYVWLILTEDHPDEETPLDCKSAVKMEIDEKYNWVLVPIRHATDSLSETVDMDEMER